MLDAFVISRMKDVKNQEDLTYRKSSIKLSRGLIYFKLIWGGGGGVIETGGLFNLEKTVVSVLHKELE